MEGCSKTSAGAVPGLPDDPLVEILSRVPAKSVCRFKCVSKACRDLISDPDNRKKLRQPMQGLFVQIPQVYDVGDGELIRMSFNFINLTVRSVPLDIDPCFSFLREMIGIDVVLLDSCNGLILLGQRQKPTHLCAGYIVSNPTTRQWSAVPASGSHRWRAYLAFDPAVSSHFHLVMFENIVLHVYSSETGTWSQNQIYEQKELGQLELWDTLPYLTECTFINGFLHFWNSDSEVGHILAVDIQGKARRMITAPSMADESQEHSIPPTRYLGQSQGQLHCVTLEPKNEEISTWVLQDYDTQEWVLKNTMCTLDVFGKRNEILVLEVIDIHQDCNVVLFSHLCNNELIAYNMDSKEVSVLANVQGLEARFRSDYARYIPYFSESPALMNKY